MVMGKRALLVAVLSVGAAACGGTCEEVSFEVVVGTVDGQPAPPAEVTVEEGTCTAEGGSYVCVVPEPGEYLVSVLPTMTQPPFYQAGSQLVDVPEPEKCDEPAESAEILLQNEAGGA
jgi:hypothetical protein